MRAVSLVGKIRHEEKESKYEEKFTKNINKLLLKLKGRQDFFLSCQGEEKTGGRIGRTLWRSCLFVLLHQEWSTGRAGKIPGASHDQVCRPLTHQSQLASPLPLEGQTSLYFSKTAMLSTPMCFGTGFFSQDISFFLLFHVNSHPFFNTIQKSFCLLLQSPKVCSPFPLSYINFVYSLL